jgi:Zn-dependent metalloprotease
MRNTQEMAQAGQVRRMAMVGFSLNAPPHPKRSIYDANLTPKLPGRLVLTEGHEYSGNDLAVQEAYQYLGDTFRFYWEAYQRNSIDDAGLPLVATVNYREDPSEPYDNAFWNGEQMIFGDGDGTFFEKRFTRAIDVVGHELTHGVTGASRNLVYLGQSGALNESVSDVFGCLLKQYIQSDGRMTGGDADADGRAWLVGDELIDDNKVKSASGKAALRSLKAPGTAYDDPVWGKDPQPSQMSRYVDTLKDNGGVHLNSGIPNRAFYFAATALKGEPTWKVAGQVWYDTIRDPRLQSNATFVEFAQRTVDNAARRFGQGSTAVGAVHDAWMRVGVLG